MPYAAALIQDGVVVNKVLANDDETGPNLIPINDRVVEVGYAWDGTSFIAPPPPPPVVPAEVTMRQARLALLSIGKLDDVSALIASLPEPQKTAATIEWEYSNTVQRNNPFVGSLGPALGVDLDALFIDAAKL